MTRMPADERRNLLIQAAIRVMSRDGVAQATTRSIVAEAGMPLGVFHYCFRSKEELVHAVMLAIDESGQQAARPVNLTPGSLVEQLIEAMRTFWALATEGNSRQQLIIELMQHLVRAEPAFAHERSQAYATLMVEWLARLADRTGHEWTIPVETVGRLQLAVTQGAVFQWLNERDADHGLAVLEASAHHIASLARPI